MKFLFEMFPILLFFITYKFGGIMLATQATIFAAMLQLIILRVFTGKIPTMSLISFVTIAILGSATLLLRNEMFIKWKPTAVYWVLSLCFLVSQYIGQQTLLQRMAGASMQLSNKIWRQLNFTWVMFFFCMGGINLYVVYNFDTNSWANFKLFGTLGLTILFLIGQAMYMAKLSQLDDRKHR